MSQQMNSFTEKYEPHSDIAKKALLDFKWVFPPASRVLAKLIAGQDEDRLMCSIRTMSVPAASKGAIRASAEPFGRQSSCCGARPGAEIFFRIQRNNRADDPMRTSTRYM